MRVLVVGGAPNAVGQTQWLGRPWATGLSRRGHQVDVLSIADCAGVPLDGVAVHRLNPPPSRDGHRQYTAWLAQRAPGYDVVVYFDLAAPTTWAGLRATAGRVATVLHPMARDRNRLYRSLFETTLRLPTALAFADTEEDLLIADRLTGRRPGGVVGIPIDVGQMGDGELFRRRIGIADRPYLLCTGSAGGRTGELGRIFAAYKARHHGSLALVVLDAPAAAQTQAEVWPVGAAGEETMRDAIAGATAVVEPSYCDGATLVPIHAWAQARPVLVDRRRTLLVESGCRSGAALPYRGFAEFEAAVDLLVDDQLTGQALGAAGRRYVEVTYHRERVLARYERLLRVTQANR